jgi:hypothetical protein
VLSSATNPLPDVSGISHETWRLFLALERCAAVLLDRVSHRTPPVDPFAISELRKVAATESQSVLRARVDGRELALIAGRLSFPVVVLKGGVNAIAGVGATVPLGDLDILVPREHVDDMVETLVSAGFGNPTKELDHHHALSAAVDRLVVEVHWTTHDDGTPIEDAVWARAVVIDGAMPLRKLGTVDHIVHIVEHAIDTHRERSVSLREVILVGDAATLCSDEELDAVRREVSHNRSMSSLFEFAFALKTRGIVDDPTFASCASFYSAVVLSDELPRILSTQGALAFVTALDLGRISRANTIRRTLKWRGTGLAPLSSVTDRFPQLGRMIVSPMRLAWYSIVAAVTIPAIRRTRRKALNSLELQTR